MAEMRRPQQRSVRAPGSGASRRGPPPRKPTHWSVWVGLVVSPVILLVLIIVTFSNKETETAEPAQKVEKVDNNAKMKALTQRIGPLDKAYKEVLQLTMEEKPNAKKKQEELRAQLRKWQTDWEVIMGPLMDKEGNLPREYKGHQTSASQVGRMLSDLNRISGF